MKTAIELIAEERNRQIESEKWSPEHDDTHDRNELALAAAAYAIPTNYVGRNHEYKTFHAGHVWPFDDCWFKRDDNDRIRELVKAGALITAEIERLQRQKIK
jgi:hypothetical protein